MTLFGRNGAATKRWEIIFYLENLKSNFRISRCLFIDYLEKLNPNFRISI